MLDEVEDAGVDWLICPQTEQQTSAYWTSAFQPANVMRIQHMQLMPQCCMYLNDMKLVISLLCNLATALRHLAAVEHVNPSDLYVPTK